MSLAMSRFPENPGVFYGGGWNQAEPLGNGASNWAANGWESYNSIWQNFRESNATAGASSSGASSSSPFGSYYLQQPSVSFYARAAASHAASPVHSVVPGGGGPGPGPGLRRGATELNHNKAITKRLAAAVHYQQVLEVISDSVAYFDEVNVATALHRLAKLHTSNSSNHSSIIVNSDQFRQLTFAITRLLPHFEPQAVSNTMWAFATLAYYPEGTLLDDIGTHAVTIIRHFRPQATANTLWAYAKLGYTPCLALLKAGAAQMVADLGKSVPQDISNTLWAFATLRQHPGNALLEGAAKQAVLTTSRFKPQEIANTLWSYATLGHDPGNQLMDAIALQMTDRIQQFRPQAVSNSLWAYARLGYNPGRELLDVAAHKAVQMLHQYSSQEIANTLWAVATLEHHPGAQLLDVAAIQIARRIEQFSPQDTTNSIWSYAKLFHYPCAEVLQQAAAMYALRHWHRFKPQEIASMLWALAILKACPPEIWRLLMEKLALVPISSFDEADQLQIYQAYLLLDSHTRRVGAVAPAAHFPHALLDSSLALWKGAVRQSGRISKLHEEVSGVLWELGVAHRNEHITDDGLFCVDIALNPEQVSADMPLIVIEVDGPSHFSVNTHHPLGRTVGRRCMLEARGFIVRSIPFYEWNSLDGPEQRKAYLTRLLASAFRFN